MRPLELNILMLRAHLVQITMMRGLMLLNDSGVHPEAERISNQILDALDTLRSSSLKRDVIAAQAAQTIMDLIPGGGSVNDVARVIEAAMKEAQSGGV